MEIWKKTIWVYFGFTGWSSGSLETELLRGGWYLWHTQLPMIFTKKPESIGNDLIELVSAQFTENTHWLTRYSTNLKSVV